MFRRVGQERADLRVLRPPGRAGVLALHAGGLEALFQKSGLVADQDTVRVAEMLHHIVTDIVAHPVDVPVRPSQQPLHAVRAGLASLLGQRPPVLTLETSDQPGHVLTSPGPWLGPPEPATDPVTQRIQLGHNTIQHHDRTFCRTPSLQLPLQY